MKLKILNFLVVSFFILNTIECKFNLKKLLNNIDRHFLNKNSDNQNNNVQSNNLKFSIQNCGPSSDPFKVNSLSLKPDPLKIPGNITFDGEAALTENINSPLIMVLKLIKIVGPFKVEIPCIDNFGSCTYNDVCSILPSPDDCPPFFKLHSIPCSCPFPSGNYVAENVQIQIDLAQKVPPGEYNILANFQNKELGHVGCVEIDLKISN